MHRKAVFIYLLGARHCSRLWDIVVNKTKLLVLMKLPFYGRDSKTFLCVNVIHSGKIYQCRDVIAGSSLDLLIIPNWSPTRLYQVMRMWGPPHLSNPWHCHPFRFCKSDGWEMLRHYKLNLHSWLLRRPSIFVVQSLSVFSVVGHCFLFCLFMSPAQCFSSLAHFEIELLVVSSLISWKISCVQDNVCLSCTANNFTWSVFFFSLYSIICWTDAFNADKCFHFFLWLYFWFVLSSDHKDILYNFF